jgi:hypothetical protein
MVVAALGETREMPPEDGRTNAMRKARIHQNAAEMQEHFLGESGAPAKSK